MDVRVGLWRKLSTEELMLLNCGVAEDSWESLGLQGDPPSPFQKRSALGVLCFCFFNLILFFNFTIFYWLCHINHAKAETPVLWPHHEKSWLIGKDSDAGRDWGQEEKGTTEYEMAGWHHWLDGSLSEFRELVMDREAWHAAIHGVAKSWTWLSDWSDLIWSPLQ